MLRRELLKRAIGLGAAALVLSGCDDLAETLQQSCPPEGERSSVNWTPDVLHPVYAAWRDIGPAEGAPAPLRIWYPSDQSWSEGGISQGRMLKMCAVRWPLVLFLHGQPPQQCEAPDLYKRWQALPKVLARSGYVVVAPQYGAHLPRNGDPAIAEALAIIDWARNASQPVVDPGPGFMGSATGVSRSGWEHAAWVDARPEATAIVGHSYGALLGAFVARARPSMSSYVSLGGGFGELGGISVLQSVPAAKFFMWGTLAPSDENLDSTGLWSVLGPSKYAGVYPGSHYDYLPPWPGCERDRHTACAQIEAAAAELVALFLARHTPVNLSLTDIPVFLVPPDLSAAPNQHLGGSNLTGLRAFQSNRGCGLTLRWETSGWMGERQIGN
jgi:hypothetical protein